MMRYLFPVALLTLLFTETATSQLTISGKVSDENGPLPFANVYITETDQGVSADDEGQFTVPELPSGKYTLRVSYLGYKTTEKVVTLTGDDHRVNFVLTPDQQKMEEIVVTGTMKPRYVSSSPVKVDVISARQLDTYLPSAGSSILDNIQLVNGIQEVTACGVCFTNSISINGLPGPYTAVLMDGMPIYGNLASVYGLNGIPNMIIDRFEVIKGPSSTLYGSEAVAGVINIITKDPSEQPLLSVDIMGTSHLESFGNIAVAPRIGKSHGFIGLNHAYINDFDDVNKDGFGDGVNLDRYSLFSKWDIHRASGKPFTIAGKYYFEDRRNGVEEFLVDRNYRELRGSDSIYGESIYTHRGEIFGSYTLNTKANLKVDFSLSHHDQDSYYGSDHYEALQRIAFANMIWDHTYKKHDIIAGLTARYNAYDDNSQATEKMVNGRSVNDPNNQFIPGIFVQDENRLSEKLTLLGGMRLDHYESHGLIPAPRLNIKYNPSTWSTFRLNFGTGFRIVNLFTEDHAFVTGQREVVIEETLDPERSFNLSLNYNQTYALWGGSGTLDIEGYFTHFTNKIYPDYDTPEKIVYANSDGYARTAGLGFNLAHTFLIPLGFDLGANVQRATETEENLSGEEQTRNIEFSPDWSATLSVNYKWSDLGLTLAYTARATGPMALPTVYDIGSDGEPLDQPRDTRSQPFSIHNFQVTKAFNDNLSIYAGIQNITNFRQAESPLVGYDDPNARIGFSDYFDTSYAYAPIHGREIYIGIKWSLKGGE